MSTSLLISGPETPLSIDRQPGAVLVTVPPGAVLHEPIRLVFTCAGEEARTRVTIKAGAGSKATIVEELRGTSSQWTHDCDIVLEEEAQVEYVSAQLADPATQLTLRQRSTVAAGASVAWRNATLGGASVDADLRSSATGRDAASDIDWLFYARGSESYKIAARNAFRAPAGSGEITMRGVAEERGHVSCDALIEIGLGSAGTDTYLTQDVLMLDPTARVDAVPGLEIKTNDVKASHSATVSRVTDEDLFYFATRGIPRAVARGMYVQGFLGGLTERATDPAVRTTIVRAIEAKFGGARL